MVACEACGASDLFLFRCEHCEGQFCADHRPPGDHRCAAAPVETSVAEAPDPEPTGMDAAGADGDSRSTQVTPSSSTPSIDLEAWLPSTRTVLGIAALLFIVAAVLGGYALFGPTLEAMLSPALGGASTGQPAGSTDGAVRPVNQTAVERTLADRVNALRREHGVTAVAYDPALAEIARYHSRDMAARNYTGHVGPEGETVQDRFARFDYRCEGPSELVLFTHYATEMATLNGSIRFENESELANGAVELWLQSTSHREALLTPSWERLGVGVHVTDSDRVFVTLEAC